MTQELGLNAALCDPDPRPVQWDRLSAGSRQEFPMGFPLQMATVPGWHVLVIPERWQSGPFTGPAARGDSCGPCFRHTADRTSVERSGKTAREPRCCIALSCMPSAKDWLGLPEDWETFVDTLGLSRRECPRLSPHPPGMRRERGDQESPYAGWPLPPTDPVPELSQAGHAFTVCQPCTGLLYSPV